MYLEHVNLVVKNIDTALTFYRAAFPHWKVRSKGNGEWFGKPRTWLHFGDDHHYLAFSDHGEGQNRVLKEHQVGLGHFAYVVNSIDGVVKRLEQAGFEVDKVGPVHAYRKNVYFIDPDGFEVEFVEYLSDIPAQRNSD
ncbi:VOC family protein [Pseudoalteromonas luteoviolacea]|uniref:Glyoxalase n=1 Tax=Pseudoalteromonas luteoviolacea H33 TaxID=1365251 RepID=A0A166ZS28_9GAMM|nr:VOC family protein [Pseudoalteromonas luteoviolacea]KZN44604.1 glyoxalase [Pseudoalteromonas luteoviolacea H33]KZN75406.1 glyoxalase [Pseudoalteromonas luteoviolacea H33-S]MBQ4877976.1 VOC family protein [Pseudoalteromonas luteoviolacea]MBQ4907011.1 VOC family protein [Pseudoalteromonas luteoviolacea]